VSETGPLIAFLDACVLYPALLRNILMHLAVADLFRARWSDRVHDEWIAALLKARPDLTRERLARIRTLMEAHTGNALVSGYEHLIARLWLPDPDDRHVLAAAIHCGATVIVTANLRDFPPATLAGHGVTVQHPDAFLLDRFASNPADVLNAIRTLRLDLKNPPRTVVELLSLMERQNLAASAAALRPFTDAL
jgi:predicted nucleic acid-binding protein